VQKDRANSDPLGQPKIAPPVWVGPRQAAIAEALADARFIADQKT